MEIMEQVHSELTFSNFTAAEFDERIEAATDRIAAESQRIRQETDALRVLVERKQRLVARLEAILAELQAEQSSINLEVKHLLTPEEQHIFTSIGNA